jgi:hypothetical protein
MTVVNPELIGNWPDGSDDLLKLKSIASTRLEHDSPTVAGALESSVGDWLSDELLTVVGAMVRPATLSAERDRDALMDGAYWQWNEHDWIPSEFGKQSQSLDQPSVSEPVSSQPG